MSLITICLIAKNEENFIEKCLLSLHACQLPMLLTDTGSTDRTIEIAQKHGAGIAHFDWCDDFSKARNFCASKAETDWIWMVDCDEYLVTEHAFALESSLKALLAFSADKQNESTIGTILRKDAYPMDGEKAYATSRMGRIYNRRFYHYTGSIHEQLTRLGSHLAAAPDYLDLPLLFHHGGYEEPALLQKKCRRNIALLETSIAAKEDPYSYYQLGKAYFALKAYEAAIASFQKGLSFDIDPSLYYVQSMVETYGYSLLALKRYKEALSFENIYDTFAVNADFIFLMGLIYMNNAMFDAAIAAFQKATQYKTSVVEGVNSYKAFYNIGVIYECSGHAAKAIESYRKCQDFAPAKRRLEELTHA